MEGALVEHVRAEPFHRVTPLLESWALSQVAGMPVFLKYENVQPAGSFKIRGIGHFCQQMAMKGCRHLVCSSGGNAGIAAAYSARKLGIPVTIVLPENTSTQVVRRLEWEGAEVQLAGKVWDEANIKAQELATRDGWVNVSPFDHPLIWEGHASLVQELKESLGTPPGAVVLAVGGGGLLAGVTAGLLEVGWQHVPIVAMETRGAHSFNAALQAGRLVTLPDITSVAKSLGAKRVAARTLECAKECEILSEVVEDREAVKAVQRFLGPGESGKSTFIKQMRIIHGAGYSEDDRRAFRPLVYQNIFVSMQAMIDAMDRLQIPYSRPDSKQHANLVMTQDPYKVTTFGKPYAVAMQYLWRDAGIRACYERRREFHLLDSAMYYLSRLERISEDSYIPTAQDVLRSRMPTTGINEYCFSVQKTKLRIVDVGGQKSERKKWIHCFENVIALIYLASLSEYDQCLEENDQENRMKESLALFSTILELPWFKSTSVILFLNKTDILEEKIHTSHLATYFPSFQGPPRDAEAAKRFIMDMYARVYAGCAEPHDGGRKGSRARRLFAHFTCATDTHSVRSVFKDVRDSVLARYLDEINLL